MDPRQRYLEEQMQRTEPKAEELHRNLHELRTKYFQLEQAFEINLQLQTKREIEFNRIKHEKEELQKFNDGILKTRTELNSRLMNAIIEKDLWKNASLRQKDFIMSNKIEYSNAVALIKRECENILKMTRETTEKQFRELIELYNEAREKGARLEEQIETYQISQREHENRSFELANLLEILKRFDVDVSSLCQLVAEALKNLIEPENLFDESMKNLRQLTWTTKNKKDEPELVLLRKQNFVLKEVVKNLKKKFQVLLRLRNEIPERENEQRNSFASHKTEMTLRTLNGDLPEKLTFSENCAVAADNSTGSITQENYENITERHEEHNEQTSETVAREKNNRSKEFDNRSKIINNRERVMCVESHLNGLLYEEYILKLSIDREIKLKYPVLLNYESIVKMEFVDKETEYERAPLDGIVIFFKNIYACVNVKQTGVPCGTQTMKMKTSNSFTQTMFTGLNSVSRLNVGVRMLNSEKRAIERSLTNLEGTVKTLKFNTLDQARTMISNNSHYLENGEFFECIRALS
ncbi:uncharacterized protein LOC143348495 [Colletes latitarsis]|uniref:uncharacterized protein LOC143348495 n=1 Tax=Colletes latitarsis TaxID=2605962 RepID=UPI0040360AF2